jgi:hypothetical protein
MLFSSWSRLSLSFLVFPCGLNPQGKPTMKNHKEKPQGTTSKTSKKEREREMQDHIDTDIIVCLYRTFVKRKWELYRPGQSHTIVPSAHACSASCRWLSMPSDAGDVIVCQVAGLIHHCGDGRCLHLVQTSEGPVCCLTAVRFAPSLAHPNKTNWGDIEQTGEGKGKGIWECGSLTTRATHICKALRVDRAVMKTITALCVSFWGATTQIDWYSFELHCVVMVFAHVRGIPGHSRGRGRPVVPKTRLQNLPRIRDIGGVVPFPFASTDFTRAAKHLRRCIGEGLATEGVGWELLCSRRWTASGTPPLTSGTAMNIPPPPPPPPNMIGWTATTPTHNKCVVDEWLWRGSILHAIVSIKRVRFIENAPPPIQKRLIFVVVGALQKRTIQTGSTSSSKTITASSQ